MEEEIVVDSMKEIDGRKAHHHTTIATTAAGRDITTITTVEPVAVKHLKIHSYARLQMRSPTHYVRTRSKRVRTISLCFYFLPFILTNLTSLFISLDTTIDTDLIVDRDDMEQDHLKTITFGMMESQVVKSNSPTYNTVPRHHNHCL